MTLFDIVFWVLFIWLIIQLCQYLPSLRIPGPAGPVLTIILIILLLYLFVGPVGHHGWRLR